MKITKGYEKLTRIENGDYVLEGDLISTENIEIELDDRLVVKGSIKTKKSIIVQRTLIAGCGIEAGCGIKAGCGIEAGWGIKAKTFIHSEKRIFAGISLYKTSDNCDKTIKCAELRKGEICYGELILTKKEPKSFRVICTEYKKSERYFTIGRIYTWEDGKLKNDTGFVYTDNMVAGSDPEKWDLSAWYKFIVIKEEKEGN